MKQSIIDKWTEELNNHPENLLVFDVPENYYTDDNNLQEALGDTVETFCRNHNYSEKTENEMLDCIEIIDKLYKALEGEGYKLPSDIEK